MFLTGTPTTHPRSSATPSGRRAPTLSTSPPHESWDRRPDLRLSRCCGQALRQTDTW